MGLLIMANFFLEINSLVTLNFVTTHSIKQFEPKTQGVQHKTTYF